MLSRQKYLNMSGKREFYLVVLRLFDLVLSKISI
jgi:hypothetical protein